MLKELNKDKWIKEIDLSLISFSELKNYKYLFSSKEWLSAYTDVYKPEKVLFILDKQISSNYIVLAYQDRSLIFLGGSFNDFNGFFNTNLNQALYFKDLIKYCKKNNLKLQLNSLFEESAINYFNKFSIINKSTVSLRIKPVDGNFSKLISKRIRKMYEQSGELKFERQFLGCKTKQGGKLLNWLLDKRNNKLNTKKTKEFNLSFEEKFDNLILKFCFQNTLNQNVYIDYCMLNDILLACSLNFKHGQEALCYLRAHTESSNNVSYGLILDYWGALQNERENIKLLDLTRGNESYKYRLGAQEYYLQNLTVYEKK